MTSQAVSSSDAFANDRTGTILGVAGGVLGGGAILFFWSIGAIGLLGGNGGFVQDLALTGAWRTLFLFYPFVFVAALVVGGVLVALRRDLEAVGAFGLPVAAAVLYYLALIHLRAV
jgi:hypothetical protein